MSITARASTPRQRKSLAAVAALFIAFCALALIGGSLAVLTDLDQTEAQPLVAGTVDIDVENDVMPNFNVPIEPMAAGDSFARYVNVRNKGNLATRPLSLSQVNGAGLIIQGDYGVLVSVDACDEAWVGGKCGGEQYSQALPPVQVRGWNGFTPLTMPGLQPGQVMHFKFTTILPDGAPNQYQTEASWIKYTFNGVQRGPVDHDGQNTPVEEPQLSGEPTLTATVIEAQKVQLSWLATQGAVTYRAERATSPDGPWTLISIGQDRSLIDASVEPGTTYYYRAVAYGDTADTKLASATVEVSTWMEAVTPKINLEASYETLSTTASWAEVKGAKQYSVYRGLSNEFDSAELVFEATDPSKNTVENEGEEATAYYYWLQVSDGHSTHLSDPTKIVVPLRPIAFKANPDLNSATLSWTDVPGASYRLMKNTAVVYEGTSTSFQAEDLIQGKSYYYALETTYKDAASRTDLVFSTLRPGDTSGTNVNTKVNLTYSATPTSIKFDWNALQDATSYMLLESDTNEFPTPEDLSLQRRAPLYAGTATTYTHETVQYTKSYYRLYVYTARGIFAADAVTVTTPPTPSDLSLTPSSFAGTVSASWTASDLPDVTYQLQLLRGNSWTTVADGASTSYTVSSLEPGTYSLRVATVTATGERSYSAQQAATLEDLGGLTEPIVTVAALPAGEVSVKWEKVDNAVSYRVESRLKGTTSWTGRSVTETLSATFFGGNGEEVEVRVAAIAGSSKQVYSTTHSLITTLVLKSAAVSTSFVTEGLRISASMEANDKIVSYYYLLSTDSSMGNSTEVYSGDKLQPAVAVLPANAGKLYVQVRARDIAGRDLTLTPVAVAYTPPAAPASASAVLASDSTYTVTWAPSSTATKYEIRDGATVLLSTTATSASLTLAGGVEYTNLKVYAIRGYTREGSTEVEVPSATGAGIYANPNVSAPTIAVTASDVPSVTLSWSAVPNATQYVLERSAVAGMTSPTTVYTGAGSAFKDTTLPKNTVQYYRVKVTAANGSTAVSNVISASTVLESMDATATVLSTSQVRLNWTAVSGATRYQVYVSGTNNSNLATYSSPTTSLTTTVGGLVSGADYQLRVLALDASNKPVAGSETFRVTTPTITPTISQTGSNWTNKTVSIAFTQEEAKNKYLETSQDGGATWTLTGPVAFTSSVACEPETTCLVRGYLTNTNGVKQPYTNTLTVRVQPAAPSGYTATDLSNGDGPGVRLTWTPSAGADSYKIYRRVAPAAYVEVGTSATTSYTDTNVAYATTYNYAIFAVSASGVESAGSATGNAYTKAKAATLAPITTAGPNTVTLTWDQTSLTPVRIYRDGTVIANLNTAATSYTDTTVKSGATYEYYIEVGYGTSYVAASNKQSVSTPIASPEIVSSASTVGTQLTVNWNAVNAKSILVQYSTSADFSTTIGAQTLAGSATTYTINGLTAGTEYHVRLLTEWAETSSTVSKIYTTGTITAAPVPTATSTTTPGVPGASLKIQWPAVPNAEAYLVEWDTSSTFNSARYGSATTTDLNYSTGETLPNETLYYYRVSASTKYRTATSTVRNITTYAPYSTISDVNSITDYSAYVTIDWVPTGGTPYLRVVNAAGTTVYSGDVKPPTSGTRTSTYIYGLKPGEDLTVKLEAGLSNASPRAVPVTFKAASAGPDLDAIGISATQLSLSWTEVPGATSYELYSGKNLNASPIYVGPNTNYIASAAGTYFVRARTEAGLGAATYVDTYSIAMTTIPGFKVTRTSDVNIRLSWDPVPYRISYICSSISNGSGANQDAPTNSWLSSTSFAPTGATSVNVATNRTTKPYCYILDDQYVRWARVVSAAKAPRW